jgi:predicted RNA-binding Zn ribbon-like protein
MVTSPQPRPPYDFEFIGGALCLDFTNTLGRGVTTDTEHLERYEDLVRWGLQAEILDEQRADRLCDAAHSSPSAAEAALERARELREVIYRIFAAEVRDTVPESEDLAALNTALAYAMARSRLAPVSDGFAWGWEDTDELGAVLWPVVRSAAELLTSSETRLLKECGSDTCEWLFLDSSKNKRRRWCDMRSCGNLAKVRRHRRRRKAETR